MNWQPWKVAMFRAAVPLTRKPCWKGVMFKHGSNTYPAMLTGTALKSRTQLAVFTNVTKQLYLPWPSFRPSFRPTTMAPTRAQIFHHPNDRFSKFHGVSQHILPFTPGRPEFPTRSSMGSQFPDGWISHAWNQQNASQSPSVNVDLEFEPLQCYGTGNQIWTFWTSNSVVVVVVVVVAAAVALIQVISPMKLHVRGWATLFVSTEWVPKVNFLQNGRLRGSTEAFFLTKWQDKPGICYRMVTDFSRKRIVSGTSARKCPLQNGRTLNEIFRIYQDSSGPKGFPHIPPNWLLRKSGLKTIIVCFSLLLTVVLVRVHFFILFFKFQKSKKRCTLPRKMCVFHSFWLFFS